MIQPEVLYVVYTLNRYGKPEWHYYRSAGSYRDKMSRIGRREQREIDRYDRSYYVSVETFRYVQEGNQ